MSITVHLPNADQIRKKFDTQIGGELQKLIDNEVLRLSAPHVPIDTGNLHHSGIIGTVVGSGEVRYNAEYAAANYYGEGRKFSGAPIRGDHWIDKMKAAGGIDKILNSIKLYMRKKS